MTILKTAARETIFNGNHLINMFWLSEKQDSVLKLVNNFMVELYSIVSIIRAVVF